MILILGSADQGTEPVFDWSHAQFPAAKALADCTLAFNIGQCVVPFLSHNRPATTRLVLQISDMQAGVYAGEFNSSITTLWMSGLRTLVNIQCGGGCKTMTQDLG